MRIPRTGASLRGGKTPASTAISAPDANDEHDWFADRADAAGLRFVHFNGMSGQFYFPEIMPPGVGLLDYDNDGDLDVFLVQGDMIGPGKTLSDALIKPVEPLPLRSRLYRNDLQVAADGTRTLRFTDVTEQSGIDARGYGMGVATGGHRQRRLGRSLSHVSRDQPAVPQQRQWDVHRRVGVEWHRRSRMGRLRLVL